MYKLTITNAPHGVSLKEVDAYNIKGDMVYLYENSDESNDGGVIKMGVQRLVGVYQFNVLHIEE